MKFDHEKLDVYRVSLNFVAWVYRLAPKLKGHHRFARDQLLRASQSIPQNIAEGNGKRALADRKRYFEIARGSSTESASIIDILKIGQAISDSQCAEGKDYLIRIVSMLSKMTIPKKKIQ